MAAIFQKIIAFFMSILAFFGINFGGGGNNQPADEPETYVVTESKVEFSFFSNPSTGYTWEVELNGDSVEKTGENFVSDDHAGMAGAGGTQYYTFTAVHEGVTTVTFRYLRPWEDEDPIETYTAVVRVDADLHITVD
ncbi:MAG: protease inhibitor I42 family protein [Clostridia bacterium]|nr:protease inhibitor I42 family protein [Clostridia bacterium]